MYYSYQLYTENMGLSYCILGMGNLTGYVHVPVKYESFWKIISIKNAILKFVLLVGTSWRLLQNERILRSLRRTSANSTRWHQGADWNGPERIEQLVSGLVQEAKFN